MISLTENEQVNYKLARFKLALDQAIIKKCNNVEWIFEKLGDVNCKLTATKFIQINYEKWIGNTALHLAAITKDLEAFEIILNYKADFTIKNYNDSTALHLVIEKSTSILDANTLHDKFVNLVLSAHLKYSNFENPLNKTGLSHFHIACGANNSELVQKFLDNGVSVNHAVKTDSLYFPGFSPLHFAARYCAFEVAEVLLLCDANINIKDTKGMTPLNIVLERNLKILSEINYDEELRDKNEKILSLFLEKESEDGMLIINDWGLSHFHIACTMKDSKIAESFLQKFVDIDHSVNNDSPMWSGYTALHFACLANINIVKILLKKGANMEVKDAKGITPLDICVKRYKAEDIYAILLLNPIWKTIELSDGKTKLINLIFAMRNIDHLNNFLRKLSKNFSICYSPLWPGCTPMHLAVIFSKEHSGRSKIKTEEINLQILRKLFMYSPSMLHSQDTHGYTPLHLAFRQNKKQVLDLLLEFQNRCSECVNRVDEDGLSYVHIASAKNDKLSLVNFLAASTDINALYKGSSSISSKILHPGSTALHFAVANESLDAVKKLLEAGAHVYIEDANGMTPIHLILSSNNTTLGDILLQVPDLRDCVVSGIGLSHLHAACLIGNLKAVERLLDVGADINGIVTDNSNANGQLNKLFWLKQYANDSPLSLAFREDHFSIVELLLLRGADIFVKTTEGYPLLYDVFETKYNCCLEDFLEILRKNVDLQARLKADIGMTMLHVACRDQDNDIIKQLLEQGADINAKMHSDSPIWAGYTPMHVLVWSDDKDNYESDNEIINLLIEKGADVTLTSATSETAVHIAFKQYNDNTEESEYSRLTLLLEAQRDFSLNPVNDEGISHFHIACNLCNTTIVEKFLVHGSIEINRPTECFNDNTIGCTPLHLAVKCPEDLCKISKKLDTVDLLLKHGADVHAEDEYGDTPLHDYADSTSSSFDVFERIVRSGADVNARNIRGNTPLYYFFSENKISVEGIKTLLRFGCRLNTFSFLTGIGYVGQTLRWISYTDMQNLISTMTVNFTQELDTDKLGRTIIHNAVSAKEPKISEKYPEISVNQYAGLIEQLSKTGCDVDDQDKFGRTALHLASKLKNFKAVSGLLLAGADVNISDISGKTAFTWDFLKFAQCSNTTQCSNGNTDNSDSEKCEHLRMFETFAIHVKKLQLCGLDVSKLNEKLASEAFDKFKSKKALTENFFKELEKIKTTKFKYFSLTLSDFLSENGAVVDYPTMSQIKRRAVDSFFSPSRVLSFRGKFPELAGIIQLQYRKARARKQLVELAKSTLALLVGFRMPEICSHFILIFLKNSDLNNLIASIVSDEGIK